MTTAAMRRTRESKSQSRKVTPLPMIHSPWITRTRIQSHKVTKSRIQSHQSRKVTKIKRHLTSMFRLCDFTLLYPHVRELVNKKSYRALKYIRGLE